MTPAAASSTYTYSPGSRAYTPYSQGYSPGEIGVCWPAVAGTSPTRALARSSAAADNAPTPRRQLPPPPVAGNGGSGAWGYGAQQPPYAANGYYANGWVFRHCLFDVQHMGVRRAAVSVWLCMLRSAYLPVCVCAGMPTATASTDTLPAAPRPWASPHTQIPSRPSSWRWRQPLLSAKLLGASPHAHLLALPRSITTCRLARPRPVRWTRSGRCAWPSTRRCRSSRHGRDGKRRMLTCGRPSRPRSGALAWRRCLAIAEHCTCWRGVSLSCRRFMFAVSMGCPVPRREQHSRRQSGQDGWAKFSS